MVKDNDILGSLIDKVATPMWFKEYIFLLINKSFIYD